MPPMSAYYLSFYRALMSHQQEI
ncbi:hypothetical protein XAC3810_160002 [Xanthomonas citri pv. citri]|uniref:Uncharacterized protein n=1 Tax=Xanthomonas citri pv. citri TaxID=611301 RepID=A0A0U5FCB5_XANCI|nr:hypothetical protein XAC3824_140107 [Xanthomonas citri pv. citri]CEE18403.1 hypothetical protein XAC9322_140251 [Xanthomonas citri pv. citri]CEE19416.1 hypothetical protein XAC1083_150111 [Xanthomonas citri pv. citri]CEE26725.1 hypothetical protein XAC902_160150 [Xanthomonas citri pv. citri]CEE27223.1 hypothetical protein XAC3810_160002 [Xanthomonas citri pv. citri]